MKPGSLKFLSESVLDNIDRLFINCFRKFPNDPKKVEVHAWFMRPDDADMVTALRKYNDGVCEILNDQYYRLQNLDNLESSRLSNFPGKSLEFFFSTVREYPGGRDMSLVPIPTRSFLDDLSRMLEAVDDALLEVSELFYRSPHPITSACVPNAFDMRVCLRIECIRYAGLPAYRMHSICGSACISNAFDMQTYT
jgi:hypothetical protein